MSKIRILIAEDHPLMRMGLVATLQKEPDMEVVGIAQNGEQALALFRTLTPDVSILDLWMPILNGLGVIAGIQADQPNARIVMLTATYSDVAIERASAAGVDVLLKHMCKTDLVEAVRAAYRGERPPVGGISSAASSDTHVPQLTAREVEVLRQIANGQSNREVGEKLGITEFTVKGHVKALMSKLGASDRTHAVMIALRRGWLSLENQDR